MTYTPGRVVGSPEQDIYQGPDDPGTALPYGTPYTWHEVDALGQHVDTHYKVAGRPDLAANLDTAVTAVDANAESTLRVQQDARLSSTYVARAALDLLEVGEGSMMRGDVSTSAMPLTSGGMRLAYFTALKTEAINSLRLLSSGTAAGATPTLAKAGVFSVASNGDLTLVASTANTTTLFDSTFAVYTPALTASLSKVAGQRYALGVLVVTGATVPTTYGSGAVAPYEAGMPPRMSGLVTGLSDLPATVAAGSITDSGNRPYGVLLP